MNRLLSLRRSGLLLVLALAASWQIHVGAQGGATQATSTTLSAAVNYQQTVITVASATGFTVNNYLYVIGSNEAMRIRAISGTSITVLRGQLGTQAKAHPNSAVVVTGVVNHFKNTDPDFNGICTVGNASPGLDASYGPWINVFTGAVWHCPIAGNAAWVGTQRANITFNTVTLTR